MERKSLLHVKKMTVLKKSGITCLLTLLLMICMCGYRTQLTYAAGFSDAREIRTNQDVYDSVINGSEYHQNFYKFTTTQSGYVTIHFSNPVQRNAEEYWKVSFYNSYYEELYSEGIFGNQTRTELLTTGIPAGTYYVKIASAAGQQAKSTDQYTFRADFTASENWEKEINDNFLSASPMELNMEYSGTTRSGSDMEKDYYRLTVSQPGCMDIVFSSPQQKSQEAYWKVHLYNSFYEEICNKLVYGNQTTTNLPSIGLDRGIYYIKVTSASWSAPSSKDIYRIRANFRTSDVWEKEMNDDFTTATEINTNTTYYGTTNDGTDYEKDYFRFQAITAGNYRIQMRTPNMRDGGAYWKLYLYDNSYKQMACIDIFGNQTVQYIDRNLPAGMYFAMVSSANWHEARTTDVYELSVVKLNDYGQPEIPTQPAWPTQPTQPVVPTQPTQPVVPTQPSQPVTPTTPSEPEDDYCSVEWNVSSATLMAGQTTDALVAEVTGDDEVELYASSNTGVLSVQPNGIMTAYKTGTAVVRAITKRGNVAIIVIKVQKKAIETTGITVDTKKVVLKEGETHDLDAELTPVTSSEGIRYTSVNSKIAIVNRSGVIKAKKQGKTTIKVKSGKKTVKVKVTVK